MKFKKEFFGFSWAFADQFLQLASQLINLIIITSLFTPFDFGVFGIALIIIGIANNLFSLGFSAPLIQFDNHNKYYGTAWTLNIFVSVILFLVIYFNISTIINNYFTDYSPFIFELKLMLFTLLFTSFSNIGVIELYRERKINKLLIIRGAMELLKVILCLMLYKIYDNFLALIYSYVITSFVTMVLTYLIAPIKNNLNFKFDRFKKLYFFSVWIQLKNIGKVLVNYFDSTIVAALLNPNSLGILNRSITISKVPERIFNNINETYTYSFLSEFRDSHNITYNFLSNYILFKVFVLSNINFIFIIFGQDIIDLVFGQNWSQIFPILTILLISTSLNSIINLFYPLFRAHGLPKSEFKLYSLRVLIILIFSYPLIIKYGLIGAAYSQLFSVIFVIPITFKKCDKLVRGLQKLMYNLIFVWVSLAIFILYAGLIKTLNSNYTFLFFLIILYNTIGLAITNIFVLKIDGIKNLINKL